MGFSRGGIARIARYLIPAGGDTSCLNPNPIVPGVRYHATHPGPPVHHWYGTTALIPGQRWWLCASATSGQRMIDLVQVTPTCGELSRGTTPAAGGCIGLVSFPALGSQARVDAYVNVAVPQVWQYSFNIGQGDSAPPEPTIEEYLDDLLVRFDTGVSHRCRRGFNVLEPLELLLAVFEPVTDSWTALMAAGIIEPD